MFVMNNLRRPPQSINTRKKNVLGFIRGMFKKKLFIDWRGRKINNEIEMRGTYLLGHIDADVRFNSKNYWSDGLRSIDLEYFQGEFSITD